MKTLETDKRNILFIAGVLFLGLTLIIGFVLGNKGLMYNLTLEGSKYSKIVR